MLKATELKAKRLRSPRGKVRYVIIDGNSGCELAEYGGFVKRRVALGRAAGFNRLARGLAWAAKRGW